jgi:[acyl-carrier-protein] S-malonyltransferase
MNSATKKERIVAICPGRGSYTRDELSYFSRYRPRFGSFIDQIDQWRSERSESTVSEMDGAAQFQVSFHTPGENASILIHTCAMLDFMAIDRDRFEIVAVTGNSLGWYLTLAAAGALNARAAFDVVNTMGSMMRGGVVGGQVIYPVVDADWRHDPDKEATVAQAIADVVSSGEGQVYPSIYLGGYRVIGGDETGIRSVMKRLPVVDERYPFKLVNHAAFHTPILESISAKAFDVLPVNLFEPPKIPMIDGRGKIWQPYATDVNDLYEYTLGHQVCRAYDFTTAITVSMKEFAPDRLVLLGPGASLGGSIGQIMIQNNWRYLDSKQKFSELQEKNPYLLSMGRPEQRELLV